MISILQNTLPSTLQWEWQTTPRSYKRQWNIRAMITINEKKSLVNLF